MTRCKRECQLRTRRTKSKTNQNSSYCDVSMRRCGGANKERAQKNKNNTFNILLRPLWEVHITPQKNILMPTFLKHPKTSQGYLSVGKQRNATEEQKQYFNILQRPLWSVHITSQNNIFMPTFSKHPKTSQGCLCSLGCVSGCLWVFTSRYLYVCRCLWVSMSVSMWEFSSYSVYISPTTISNGTANTRIFI